MANKKAYTATIVCTCIQASTDEEASALAACHLICCRRTPSPTHDQAVRMQMTVGS
jgi:hypothetical protein